MSQEFERSSCVAIVQALPQAVILVDTDLRIVIANRTASQLFKLAPDRLRGSAITELIPHGDLASWLHDVGARPRTMETSLPGRARRAPMTVRLTALSMVIMRKRRWQGGAARRECRLLVLEDITETTVLEAQLVESEKQGAMGQLAAGILHEVRNPVGSLGANLLFIRHALEASDPTLLEALDVSLEHLEQMRQLLGTLSGFPRRSAPRYELADLHDVIRRSVAFISKEAERRAIQLTVSFAPAPVICEMDVRMMKQVLLNLLKNSMEAMPEGGRLEVRTCTRAPDQHAPASVLIEIADDGIGIPEADLRLVFRPMFSSKPRGAGLGLSFCRQAVEEHGGEIQLMSRGKGTGTTAHISLPLRQPI